MALQLALTVLALGSCSRELASPIAPVAVSVPAARPDVLGELAGAIAIQEAFSDEILAMPGVAGIATGWDRGRAVLVVLVESSEVAGRCRGVSAAFAWWPRPR